MKLTLEQLAIWLACTFEPDVGAGALGDEAKLLASLSKEALAKSGVTRSDARHGFLQGVNDRVTQMEWWTEGDRRKVDALLAARGLPDLKAMELLVKKKHQRILSRGMIKTDEEYYLVKEFLDGPHSDLISEEEIRTLFGLRLAYESGKRE